MTADSVKQREKASRVLQPLLELGSAESEFEAQNEAYNTKVLFLVPPKFFSSLSARRAIGGQWRLAEREAAVKLLLRDEDQQGVVAGVH